MGKIININNKGVVELDFCKCGSIIINSKCSNAHCPEKNQKNKAWVVEGRALDFKKPVSYDEAENLAKRMNERDRQNFK